MIVKTSGSQVVSTVAEKEEGEVRGEDAERRRV